MVRVGKDRQSWQELECYLFGEMLICVKEKKSVQPPIVSDAGNKLTRCTLKGSILIKKHLKQVQAVPGRTSASSFDALQCTNCYRRAYLDA